MRCMTQLVESTWQAVLKGAHPWLLGVNATCYSPQPGQSNTTGNLMA